MKKIPIGISDFKTIIEENYYYVDKSLFIKEIIEDGSKVLLLPRPRRFGKTLNMSMLRYFYEKTEEDHGVLFEGLTITQHEDIMEKQGKYPVIYLTFKDIKYSRWEDCQKGLEAVLGNLYHQHKYLLEENTLDQYQKDSYISILSKKADVVELSNSLSQLCEYLHEHYKKKVIILIDEYDVPIQAGYLNGYYDKIIEFMRNFLSGGLKDNIHLEKAVLTGILRVSKESIFSGLNNLRVCTILEERYSQHFGFLEEEIEELLRYKEIAFEVEEVKRWYNGYVFGKNIIYNPWSILNFVDSPKSGLKPHWVNTSSNDLVKKLLGKGGEKVKQELEGLIQGEGIVKIINEDIVMDEIDQGTENIWSFLLLSGYLKVVKQELKNAKLYCNLKIPNLEVKYLYEEIIMSWFKESINSDNFNLMLKSLVNGDIETFEEILSEFVVRSVSYFDINEGFYHALVLGMLTALNEEYEVKSNRESGYGRYDVMVIPRDKSKLGIIIEFKKVNKRRNETLETAVEAALQQLKDKKYKQELESRNIEKVLALGIAFEGKELLVKEEWK